MASIVSPPTLQGCWQTDIMREFTLDRIIDYYVETFLCCSNLTVREECKDWRTTHYLKQIVFNLLGHRAMVSQQPFSVSICYQQINHCNKLKLSIGNQHNSLTCWLHRLYSPSSLVTRLSAAVMVSWALLRWNSTSAASLVERFSFCRSCATSLSTSSSPADSSPICASALSRFLLVAV